MIRKIILAFLFAGVAALFTGCESADQDESNLPWSRPAGWEGQSPGLGVGNLPGRTGY